MLDKRDIQTLMYCVRLAETHGHWQQGTPARFPNELECKLAQLLRQADRQSRQLGCVAPNGLRKRVRPART